MVRRIGCDGGRWRVTHAPEKVKARIAAAGYIYMSPQLPVHGREVISNERSVGCDAPVPSFLRKSTFFTRSTR